MSTNITAAILEQLPVGVIWRIQHTDSSQEVYANEAAIRLLELDSSNLTMTSLSQLPLHLDRELTPLLDTEAVSPSPLYEALLGHHINRRDLVFHQRPLHLKSLQVQPVPGCVAVCIQPRDHRLFMESAQTGDLSSTELSVRDLIAFDKVLSQISSGLIHSQPDETDAHIHQALAELGKFCMADRCYVFMFNQSATSMYNSHEWVAPGVSAHIDELQNISKQDLPWFFKRMQQQGLVLIHKVSELREEAAQERALFESEDIRSVACVGIVQQRQLAGFVGCDMVAREKHWSEADTRRLRLVGEIIGRALLSQQQMQRLASTQFALEQANQKLQQLADRDPLTGLANRRHFDRYLIERVIDEHSQQDDLCLLMIDIDHFKAYNDYYGHSQGDIALQSVASLLQQHFKRHGELVARFGGEEFAIILPETDSNAGVISAGHLLEKMAALNIKHPKSPAGRLSLSVGAASLSQCHQCISSTETEQAPLQTTTQKNLLLQQLIALADNALYRAKAQGRDCVTAAP